MNFSVHITETAKRDVARALDYVQITLKDPQAADALLNSVEEMISCLSHMPEHSTVADDPVLASWRVLCLRIQNFLAFFSINEEEETVYFIRFLYAKSDWVFYLRHDCLQV